MKLYQALARLIAQNANCSESGNFEWEFKSRQRIRKLVKDYMPSGSGFDCGTAILEDGCAHDKLVFRTSFHHMDDFGGYSGWTDHVVTVRASLAFDIDIKVSGRDRDGIKDYIAESFMASLNADVELYPEEKE